MKNPVLKAVCTHQDWQQHFARSAQTSRDHGEMLLARMSQRRAAEAHKQATWAMCDHQRRDQNHAR